MTRAVRAVRRRIRDTADLLAYAGIAVVVWVTGSER